MGDNSGNTKHLLMLATVRPTCTNYVENVLARRRIAFAVSSAHCFREPASFYQQTPFFVKMFEGPPTRLKVL
jgi:hypothetical protein